MQTETANLSRTPGQMEIEAAQRFAVETEHRADFHVDIHILSGALGRFPAWAGHHALDETAAVVNVAAQNDLQCAVRTPLGPKRAFVAVRRRVYREIGLGNAAFPIQVDTASHGRPGSIDGEPVEPHAAWPIEENEARAAGFSGRLAPARQQVRHSRVREI